MARKIPKRIYPIARVLRSGPWTGMTDTIEPSAARPDRITFAKNCYATATDLGTSVVGAPGFSLAGTQLGTAGNRVNQWVGQFTTTAGVEKSLRICNGVVSEYDWSLNTYTSLVTVANFATASGAAGLSVSARVYCLPFNDLLVISDGVSKPWSWNGTAGAGGLTYLSNCPILYGQPVSYFYKMFGIKAGERDTMVWSEEGDLTLGYDTSPYVNAWNFGGPKAEPLVALTATNDALGVLRPRSTTVVLGAVAGDFQTAANRSSVSERIGTTSPAGVLVLDEGTVTIDADGRPQFWHKGGGYSQGQTALWADCATTVRGIPRASLVNAQIVADDAANLIRIGIAEVGQTHPSLFLLFERTGQVPNFVGLSDDYTAQRLGTWKDTSGVPRVVHASIDDGYAYYHGTPEGTQWDYEFAAGTQSIQHTLTMSALGADVAEDSYYDRLTLGSTTAEDLDVTVDVQTPEGITDPVAYTISSDAAGLTWDAEDWDEDDWAGTAIEFHGSCNVHARGRWALVRVRHQGLGEQFSLTEAELEAHRDGREPQVA